MKFRFLGLVAILAAICLICSCGNGSGDSENAAPKTVAVSFAVMADNGGALRALTVNNPDIPEADVYQYKAKALFSSEFGKEGDTAGQWKDFVNSENGEAGIFAQGKWEFEIQGFKVVGEGENASRILVCQTNTPLVTYVNASVGTAENPIEVFVVRVMDNTGKGTLTINEVTAPTYSYDDSDATAIKCDKLEITGGPETYTINATFEDDDEDKVVSTFTNTFTEVPTGIYLMTFTVKDSAGKAVGATTKVVVIVDGEETTVTGNIDSGKWVTESFEIGYKKIELSVTDPTAAVECAQDGNGVKFTFKGTIIEGSEATTEDITYTLYVNDSPAADPVTSASGTEATFTWVTTDVDPGYYYASIVAADKATGTLKTQCADIKVTVHEAGWEPDEP